MLDPLEKRRVVVEEEENIKENHLIDEEEVEKWEGVHLKCCIKG